MTGDEMLEPDRDEPITEAEKRWCRKGMKAGIRKFAHWKNGHQYVGSCGLELQNTLKEINFEGVEYNLEHYGYESD